MPFDQLFLLVHLILFFEHAQTTSKRLSTIFSAIRATPTLSRIQYFTQKLFLKAILKKLNPNTLISSKAIILLKIYP